MHYLIVTEICNNTAEIQLRSLFIAHQPVHPTNTSPPQKKSPWKMHLQLHRICIYLRSTPLWKMPKPTTTWLNCILFTLLMYQQHILYTLLMYQQHILYTLLMYQQHILYTLLMYQQHILHTVLMYQKHILYTLLMYQQHILSLYWCISNTFYTCYWCISNTFQLYTLYFYITQQLLYTAFHHSLICISILYCISMFPFIHSFIHLFHIPLILYRCGTSHVYIYHNK